MGTDSQDVKKEKQPSWRLDDADEVGGEGGGPQTRAKTSGLSQGLLMKRWGHRAGSSRRPMCCARARVGGSVPNHDEGVDVDQVKPPRRPGFLVPC